jgi:hypothetical protein
VDFAFYLSACINHAYKREYSLEYFDDFITYAIASLGFVVDFTA